MSSPTELYNIDFDVIKKNIKEEYPNNKDYGSAIIINSDNANEVDVFCDGRIKVWGENCMEVNSIVRKVKSLFKEQIKNLIYDDDEVENIFCPSKIDKASRIYNGDPMVALRSSIKNAVRNP